MNFYELGKDVQSLMTIASSIDKRISEGAGVPYGTLPSTTSEMATLSTDFPCVPNPVFDEFDSNSFRAALHAFTFVSNTARGDDYLVATVSSKEIFDRDGNSYGSNLYLARSQLQCMVELADSLNEFLTPSQGVDAGSVDLLYGMYNYRRGPNPPGIIPIIFGVRARWTPTAGDFSSPGQGLLISLSARFVQSGGSCQLQIRASTQLAFHGPVTEFRAGSVFTQEKLNALTTAYYRARVRKKGFEELNLNAGVLVRMQLQE